MIAEQQAQTAKHQVQTATDQLRYNLFERRYLIYTKAQELIRTLLSKHHEEDFATTTELSPYFIILEEANCFFSSSVCRWLDLLMKDAEQFLTARLQPASPQFIDLGGTLTRKSREMPAVFRPELEFVQLTRGDK